MTSGAGLTMVSFAAEAIRWGVGSSNRRIPLQRHLIALLKFAPVESRLCSCKRRGKATFETPINPCARSACSRSVAVGVYGPQKGQSHGRALRSIGDRLLRMLVAMLREHTLYDASRGQKVLMER